MTDNRQAAKAKFSNCKYQAYIFQNRYKTRIQNHITWYIRDTDFFPLEQAGPLTQYDRGPSPKLRGLGFSGKFKLIATPLPSIGFTHN